MIAAETRGRSMGGLVNYLFGVGKANEHTDAHLVAGSPQLVAGVRVELSAAERRTLAAQLDWGHDEFAVDVAGGHVFHVALSNGPDDRVLTDEEWGSVARRVMADLGFDDAAKAAGRWAAVRHGVSTAGNDHVHLAVSLVRDDGTRASLWQYKKALSRSLAAIERDFGLVVLDGRTNGTGMPGYTAAEAQRAQRQGRSEPDRVSLARQVRAAAVAADDEAEFARRLTAGGLLVKARTNTQTGTVSGYAVALTPPVGEAVVWFAGGKLARDLSLPALRAHWTGKPADATAWHPTPGLGGRETVSIGAGEWHQVAPIIEGIVAELRTVAPDDQATWALAARESAGVLAVWSHRLEPTPGPLAAAADALAVSAQTPPGTPTTRPPAGALRNLRGVAAVVGQARLRGDTAAAWVLLAVQLAELATAISAAHAARLEAQRAQHTAARATVRLAALTADWDGHPTRDLAPAGTVIDPERTAWDRASVAPTAEVGALPSTSRPGPDPKPDGPSRPAPPRRRDRGR